MIARCPKIFMFILAAFLAAGTFSLIPQTAADAQGSFSGPGWQFNLGRSDITCLSNVAETGADTFSFTWSLQGTCYVDLDASVESNTVTAEYNVYPTGEPPSGNPPAVAVQSDTQTDTVTFPGTGDYDVWLYEVPDSNTTAADYLPIGDLSIDETTAVTATVSGSQAYGAASAAFTETNNAPAGVTLSGNATCTAVTGGQLINSSLPAGTYTIAPASCSGLSAPAGYAVSYNGGTFTVTQAPQVISFNAPDSGSVPGSATLTATGGDSGSPVTFSVDPASGDGVCSMSGDTVTYLAGGSCVIDANQAGNANYQAAAQVSQTITVNGKQKPVFTRDTPPLLAVAGQPYRYQFVATGTPAPTYALRGAPSWLTINRATGLVSGTAPSNVKTFKYSVTATNSSGSTSTARFTVGGVPDADIAASITCPASLRVGQDGSCTITVSNKGPGQATLVISAVTLPASLTEQSCTASCVVTGDIVAWGPVGTLGANGSRHYTVTVRATQAAGRVRVLAAASSANPDPRSGNNTETAAIDLLRR
jgi:hypothetical protein